MPKQQKKHKFTAYLDAQTMERLIDHAARANHSRSLIAEAAIQSFLSPDAAEQREAATTKRLDQIDRRMARLERDLSITLETNAIFIRFWLTTTPTLPESAAAAARAKASERYDAFIIALGRRLAKGPKLREEIAEDVERKTESLATE